MINNGGIKKKGGRVGVNGRVDTLHILLFLQYHIQLSKLTFSAANVLGYSFSLLLYSTQIHYNLNALLNQIPKVELEEICVFLSMIYRKMM